MMIKKKIPIVTCRIRTCAPRKGLPVNAHRRKQTLRKTKETLKKRWGSALDHSAKVTFFWSFNNW